MTQTVIIASAAALGLCVLIASAVGLWFARRQRRGNGAAAVFQELCAAHGLDARSRRLLQQEARTRRLASPARLFLAPELFAVTNVEGGASPRQQRLAELGTRLFGEEHLRSASPLCANEHASP